MAQKKTTSRTRPSAPIILPEGASFTKKDQILGLYLAGARSVEELSALTRARPSYIAEVLRQAKMNYSSCGNCHTTHFR